MLRARAGSAESALELAALSDINGPRSEAVITGDFRSRSFSAGRSGWIMRADGTAEFDAASIRGVLTADHIDSDVRNWELLFSGNVALSGRTWWSLNVPPQYTSIGVTGLGYIRHGPQIFSMYFDKRFVPDEDAQENTAIGIWRSTQHTPNRALTRAQINNGRNIDTDAYLEVSRDVNTFYFTRNSGRARITVKNVYGIRTPTA